MKAPPPITANGGPAGHRRRGCRPGSMTPAAASTNSTDATRMRSRSGSHHGVDPSMMRSVPDCIRCSASPRHPSSCRRETVTLPLHPASPTEADPPRHSQTAMKCRRPSSNESGMTAGGIPAGGDAVQLTASVERRNLTSQANAERHPRRHEPATDSHRVPGTGPVSHRLLFAHRSNSATDTISFPSTMPETTASFVSRTRSPSRSPFAASEKTSASTRSFTASFSTSI